jgi:hypothetical protein
VISHSLFDGESKKWKLSPPAVMNVLGNLAPLIDANADFGGRRPSSSP